MLKLVNHCWAPTPGERVVTPLGHLAVVVAIGDERGHCELAYLDAPHFGERVELSTRLVRKAPTYGSALK